MSVENWVHRMTSLSAFEESKARTELANARTPAAVSLTGVDDCSHTFCRAVTDAQRIFELIETALINSLRPKWLKVMVLLVSNDIYRSDSPVTFLINQPAHHEILSTINIIRQKTVAARATYSNVFLLNKIHVSINYSHCLTPLS